VSQKPGKPSSFQTTIALGLATAFGAGYLPMAPGTWGSIVGLLLWMVLPAALWSQLLAIAAVTALGVWSASVAERHFGRTDPGQVVIDEVAGVFVTMLLNPVGWIGAVLGFLLFRAADILKPFPARRFERLPGGLGIMADDLMAGVYANLLLRICSWAFGHLVISSFVLLIRVPR
jgi:phosphatidylglycerophosphatase A